MARITCGPNACSASATSPAAAMAGPVLGDSVRHIEKLGFQVTTNARLLTHQFRTPQLRRVAIGFP
jgi:hypothetical protein